MNGRIRWSSPPTMSLRLRVVLITACAVTAMVGVGGFLTVWAVRAEFVDSASWVSRERASEVAELAQEGALEARMPVLDEGETLVQVVSADRVVSGTENVSRARVLPLPVQPPGSMELLAVDALPAAGPGPYQVTALGTATPRGPVTVFVAVTTEDVEDVVASALGTGALGLLVLLVPLSALLWVAVGRTLAPVEAIRERADAITADQLSARVPEPRHHDEIGRLARTINAMLNRLDVSASEQRRFLADAAHELRSPVASLRAQLETTSQETLGSDGVEVENLRADALRMQALVDQLLLLARSDAGAIGRHYVTVDLDDTVGAVIDALQTENCRPGLTIDTRGVAPVQVSGDPVLLEQVVRNLVDNAAKYAAREVRVSLVRDGESAELTVDDDGPGIPETAREEVFHRFTRLDESRHRGDGGVGLGLAIVADIVRAHDGSVEVLAAPLGGARLRVRLPAGGTGTSEGRSR
jgi:signal transduction histidine kinase